MVKSMFRAMGICLLGGATACLASCSHTSEPPQKVCYPVKGQLFVKSQPAAGATVIFHPEGSTPEEWAGGFPRAQVTADGSFELATYGDKDGAPAGDYKVLVTWTQSGGNEESEDTQMLDRLGGRYSNHSASKLRATVKNGPTELPPIQLP
jgi:hypothetical protein